MKRFRNQTLLGIACSLCMLFSSCLDDNEPFATYPTLGTISSTSPITIDSDSYGTFVPNNPSVITSQEADSIGQRVLTNLYFHNRPSEETLALADVSVLDVYKILTKPADDLRKPDAPEADSFGNAPIQVTGISLSKEHFNVQFNMMGGNATTVSHRISLLLDENTTIDKDGLLAVNLRHHANGDPQAMIYWGVVSYTLASIPEFNAPECKGIKLYYNSGANLNASMVIKKETAASNESAFRRMMESSQEVSHEHALLTGKLQ